MREVDGATRCIVSYAVVWERTWDALQETIERAAPAQQDSSDALPTDERLVYDPGRPAGAPGKSQTDRVAADNAERRHDWARLGRRSRCCSRAILALRRTVKLFVPAWNRRHLHQRAFPRYPCHVADFVSPAF